MTCEFYHGPDRLPFTLDPGESPLRPFHGIISRGLMETTQDTPVDWAWCAARMDHALSDAGLEGRKDMAVSEDAGKTAVGTCVSGAARPLVAPRLDASAEREEAFRELVRRARASRVLRFDQSARCARTFIAKHGSTLIDQLQPEGQDALEIRTVRLWSVKEGHTASVWKTTLVPAGVTPPFHVALNVARDEAAGQELEKSSCLLEQCYQRNPGGMVAPVILQRRVRPPGVDFDVPVVASAWIDRALELHLPPNDGSRFCFFGVKRFITGADAPGKIKALQGRRFTRAKSIDIWRQLFRFYGKYATAAQDGSCIYLPDFEINEGDWVWSKHRAWLVALSGTRIRMPLPEAFWYLFIEMADRYGLDRPDDRRLFWRCVRESLENVIQEGGAPFPPLPIWAEKAAALPPERLRHAAGTRSDREALMRTLDI